MPTMDQLYTALRNADAAGDVDGARQLAAHIKAIQSPPADAVPSGPLKLTSNSDLKADSTLGKLAAGAGIGISDIGNTALNVLAYLPAKLSHTVDQWNKTRNADMEAVADANKDSTLFKGGRLAGNVATTLPVGGALGAGVRAGAPVLARVGMSAPAIDTMATLVQSGGLKSGAPIEEGATLAARAADMGRRALAGGVNGAASSAASNPDNAGKGAALGAILPGAVRTAGIAGQGISNLFESGAERLMQSSLKPTIAQLKSGDAATAVRTLLNYGINPTMNGIKQIRSKIGDLNDQIAEAIGTSDATVSKLKVAQVLDDVRKKFSTQVSPTSDLNSIENVANDFMAHPQVPGDDIPVALAQAMKQGTYKVLAKKYGQVGTADVEAQKGLARGLKEQIAAAVPGVQDLNSQESNLLTTLSVAERRALMDMNKNPMGLAALASNPASWAAFMLDKSALFKSLAARSLNATAQGAQTAGLKLGQYTDQPMIPAAAQAISGRRD